MATETREDGLGWKLLGDQFAVFIPEQVRGSWIKKCCGVYYHSSKKWHFLTSYITDVEHRLGLKAGESGIRDPRYHFKITFEAEIRGPEGFDDLRNKLESVGITWDRHKEVFRANFSHLQSLEKDLTK
uniref:Uncharacterized protein n=1 Tax=viral metagenome TaxID=1070528 RepID=A0A6C0CGV8_9ZZZZ